METSLHRQLKEIYAWRDARLEVSLGSFRIDVVCGDLLIEIQHGSLAGIRDKVTQLLKNHRVLVVKPIIMRKQLVKLSRRAGKIVERRLSPKRGSLVDLFDELVYFTRVFPHPDLLLDVLLVEIEEWRYPGRKRRRQRNRYHVQDQKLQRVQSVHRLRTADDLVQMVPAKLPDPFHTGQLAEALGVERWVAQKIAYCFRHTGAAIQVGKQGNSLLYRLAPRSGGPDPKKADPKKIAG